MAEHPGPIIDGIKWWIYGSPRSIQPVCSKHNLRLYPFPSKFPASAKFLLCEDCPKMYELPRTYAREKTYVLDKWDAQNFKKMKFINLDDEALPLAEGKAKNDKYFVTAKLTKSKVGERLIVYAGEKGKKSKKERTQVFVEPNIKRLAFDQTDMHPSDVFLKLEATFDDGTKHAIESPKNEK